MENLGYRLLPLWTEELIGDALEEMEKAGRYASRRAGHILPQIPEADLKAVFSGKAVWSAERQLTPAETPMPENIRGTADVAPETRQTFADNNGTITQDMTLPKRTCGETFPLYTEPFLNS